MENVKISVIVPVYNTAPYLEKCLTSLAEQTLEDIEIICINDGSTDNSEKILNDFQAKYPNFKILTQENKGQACARNRGLLTAKGEYAGFVDSDDWVDKNYFEALYNAAKRENADIACCSMKRIYETGEKWRLEVKESIILNDTSEKFAFLKIPKQCYPVNKIYKREELERHGLKFPEGMFFEDVVFTPMAVCYLTKMVTVPDVVYWYRGNFKSTVKTKNDKKQADLIKARDKFLEFAHENNIKLDMKDCVRRKHAYKIFGLTVLKIYEWQTISKFYLFGFIKIMEKNTYSS